MEKYLCVPKGSAVRGPAMTPTELASFTQHEVGLREIKKVAFWRGNIRFWKQNMRIWGKFCTHKFRDCPRRLNFLRTQVSGSRLKYERTLFVIILASQNKVPY